MDIGHENRHNARTPCNEEISFTMPVANGKTAVGQAIITHIRAGVPETLTFRDVIKSRVWFVER